jgi:CDP-glucose 4,6-dehydratase
MSAFWKDRPTLITGATGLVGSSVVEVLIESGAEVVCLVRDWVPLSQLSQSNNLRQCKAVHGEIRDQALMERVLGEYEIDTVLHLAAQTLVPVANRNPISTFESNIAGTWSVLEACRRSPKVRQIVLASSDKAYGASKVLPYDEETPLKGQHPYDVSKSCADLIAQSYAQTYGLPVVITRCGNFYGPGDLNWNRIIPGTIRSILRNEQPVIRSNGQCIRDYFYVKDGAQAYLKLAEVLSQDRSLSGEAFNFSNELQVSVIDLVDMLLRLMNSKLTPIILDEAIHEIQHQWLSARKARERLGWKPRYTLEEGLNETIQWYRALLSEPRV